MPGGGFTRTIGFYKTHPDVTQDILSDAGGVTVCGVLLTDVDVDHAHSAIEAMCLSPMGDSRLQLGRQLTAAALTMAAGGATFDDFALCDAVCTNPAAPKSEISDCVALTDAFNLSGDLLPAPFDGGPADPTACDLAHETSCTVLDPGSCAQP